MAEPLIPLATYRLQFSASFRFDDARAVVPYLAELGISTLYASPILKARPGSTHGYDVVDPTLINPELGSDADFDALCATLAAHRMQLLLDIVPNHMGVLEADNPWWFDVLENGPAARHAVAFDIEWQPPQRELHGKVLLPVLGQSYGLALETGELRPVFEPARGQFVVHYFKHRFPIDPADHAEMLRLAPLPPEAAEAGSTAPAQLASLLDGFARLPPRDTPDATARATRQREAAALKQALAAWHAEAPWVDAWLQDCARRLHGDPGDPQSFDRLDALLQRQAWRLVHWRSAGDEINYRRFFDINALAGLRMEDDTVFEAAHVRVLRWVGEGRVTGLRIDHPDGMTDPAAYFERLRDRCVEAGGAPPYLVIEKILSDGEPWRRHGAVHGDTGYLFSNQALGVFIDGSQAAAFDALYAEFVGTPVDFDAELLAAKDDTLRIALAADLRLLTERAHDIALRQRHTRDLTREGLQSAIVDLAGAFDVYRSYVSARGAEPLDVACIERSAALARARSRPSLLEHVDFVRRLLLLEPTLTDASLAASRLRFVQRFQQFTAPVMAKSMEDTAFYRYHRLLALNDVGGDPRRFGLSVDGFHAANAVRLREMPHSLLATSTHDSKRSEDVRSRLAVLSEMPELWRETLLRWRGLARAQWRIGGADGDAGGLAPNDELLLYQTLVGIWPFDVHDDTALAVLRQRIGAYMLKAVREAKQRSSWLDGDARYEDSVLSAVNLLLARLEPNPFLSDLRRFVARIAPFGACNSLALLALKMTSPGVPDFYQGNEDWAFSLVDPDNRRAVDFDALRTRLAALATDAPRGVPIQGQTQKLWLSRQLLRNRAEASALYREGDYWPLEITGSGAGTLLAFARRHGQDCSITVVVRQPWRAGGGEIDKLLNPATWRDTQLRLPQWPDRPQGPWGVEVWVDVISARSVDAIHEPPASAGEETGTSGFGLLAIGELLRDWPVAVLRPAPAH